MKVYLAGECYNIWEEKNFFDFYRLDSYLSIKKKKENTKRYKDFILDSGIFSFLNGKSTKGVDWEKYMTEYADFVRENKIKNYVEIDVDQMIGLKEVEKLRLKLNKRVGWKCMPVWHINRGYDKWLEICRDYEYICFGAFLTDGLARSKFEKIKKFLNDSEKEKCKVHGLGFTNFTWLPHLPFYSVDSSSWTVGNRFGSISKFLTDEKGTRIKNISRPQGSKIKDHRKLANHNFDEWLKFQKYADINL